MIIIQLVILAVSATLLLVITAWKRKAPARLHEIRALTQLYRMLGLSVEDGTRLHISLGSGSLLDARGGSALAGLAMLRHIAERTSVSDKPSVASAGTSVLGLLSQDTLQSGYKAAGVEELYAPATGRVAGLSPFSYAAGAMNISQDENVSANVLIGNFGPEVALITDASERVNVTTVGASDNLAGQAVLFANTQDALIGEELFSTAAYLGAGPSHLASLTVQDILRWSIILVLLGGVAFEILQTVLRIF
jgi:hypothetical protein